MMGECEHEFQEKTYRNDSTIAESSRMGNGPNYIDGRRKNRPSLRSDGRLMFSKEVSIDASTKIGNAEEWALAIGNGSI